MTASGGEWKRQLEQASLKAKAKIVGHEHVREVQHGLLLVTALSAFGDDPRATFYIEVRSTAGNVPRPDLILLHPDVGVLVVENKGVALGDIHDVEGTSLKLVRDGQFKHEDPFGQAERVMFRLRDLAKSRADLSEVLFLHTAAFPRIARDAFNGRFRVKYPPETMFADACGDPEAFKQHVLGFSRYVQQRARVKGKLTLQAASAIKTILSGKGFIYAPRRSHIDKTDANLLGVQIQQLELGLKSATQQQKELGSADLRGSHRLFRGVAGSGKSIMLALSVAQTLIRYREEHASDLFNATARKGRVLVVCFNKTLVCYLRDRIEDRFGRLAWDKPQTSELCVSHFEGVIRDLGNVNVAFKTDLTFRQKQQRAKTLCEAFDKLSDAHRERVQFDAMYVDEAQDLLPEEFELLLRLARRDAKGNQTFVVFYDNAQNIYGAPTPVWSKLGVNIVGRTVFLDQCLRNTQQTLALAFNVLVGSFAPEGVRVTTRRFADVESLRERALVEEKDGRFEIKFAPRTGELPEVQAYASRDAEIDGVVAEVRRLLVEQKVLPSDILILYQSHQSFAALAPKLAAVLGTRGRVRLVDKAHDDNKKLPLIEDGVLTVSTIASAKGYDAPIVFLLGTDELRAERTEDRAVFYVGATRAKLRLTVTGVKQRGTQTLLDETEVGAAVLAGRAPAPVRPMETKVAAVDATIRAKGVPPALPAAASPEPLPATATAAKKCRHCGGTRLHVQHGKFGYFFRCIDCTQNTPIDLTCPKCSKRGRVRKAGDEFFRDCEPCDHSESVHINQSLQLGE